MTVLFTGPSPRDASAYMRITQGESSPRLESRNPRSIDPQGMHSPNDKYLRVTKPGQWSLQWRGGWNKSLRDEKCHRRQNGFKSLWTPVREKQTFSKACPSNSVGKRFQWIVEQLEPQRPSWVWKRSWIACQSASKYIFWHPIRIISFGAAFGSNAEI